MNKKKKYNVALTYGTFDLFHVGHLNILKRISALADKVIVGVSTDEFNSKKNKKTIIPFEDRKKIVESIKYVDVVIDECGWDQKINDIKKYNIDCFFMGDDWLGKFDELKEFCDVIYMSRTENISSTEIKRLIKILNGEHINELKEVISVIDSIVQRFD